MAAQLYLEAEPPEYDERTEFWLSAFGTASRARPLAMGGIPPISPVTILDLRERLRWPAEPDEAVAVLCAMDDAFREMHASSGG
ncbi:hypothetical protein [Halomonas sp. B23F22_10]|uniref:hypothetical protein n=1 Tax=Halomonas sp. B23F22_10 TaxID=3459515 RepID=UPI00373EE29A